MTCDVEVADYESVITRPVPLIGSEAVQPGDLIDFRDQTGSDPGLVWKVDGGRDQETARTNLSQERSTP